MENREPYDVMKSGERKIFKHNKNKEREQEYDFKPIGKDGEMWNTLKLDKGLLQQIINDEGVCEAGMYIQDKETFKLVIKPKWKANKNKESTPDVPDAIATTHAEIDDKIPF